MPAPAIGAGKLIPQTICVSSCRHVQAKRRQRAKQVGDRDCDRGQAVAGFEPCVDGPRRESVHGGVPVGLSLVSSSHAQLATVTAGILGVGALLGHPNTMRTTFRPRTCIADNGAAYDTAVRRNRPRRGLPEGRALLLLSVVSIMLPCI